MSDTTKLLCRCTSLAFLSFGAGYIAKMSETDKNMIAPFIFLVIATGFCYLMLIFDSDNV